MKKKWLLPGFVVILLIAAAIFLHTGSNVRHVKRIAAESTICSQNDIRNCMDLAIEAFSGGFDGCKLLTIAYDEGETLAEMERQRETDGSSKWMVLVSDFYAEKNAEACFNPSSMYTGWKWIFQNDGNGWEMVGSGYA